MHGAQLSGPRMRRFHCQRGAFCSSLSAQRTPCRIYRSSATCSTATRGLTRFLYLLIVRLQELSHTEVYSIAILPLISNATGHAYILGGYLCEDAHRRNCTGLTSTVEMLDMSLGKWQKFPVSLGRVDSLFQTAMLDHELGASLKTNNTVNNCFSDECGYSITTTAPSRLTTQSGRQACIAFVLDESGSIVTTAFHQVDFFGVKAQ